MTRYLRRNPIGKWNNKIVVGVCVGVILGFFSGAWMRQSLIPCIQSSYKTHGGQNNYPDDISVNVKNDVVPASLHESADVVSRTNFSQKGVPRPEQPSVLLSSPGLQTKKLILIGVMTAKKYLNSRIIASYQTWAKTIPGDVIYFSSEGSEDIALPGLPVIGLKGVDDSYPPQKKSFLMLKHMHDVYQDQYEWFMRADDDLYIKGEDLCQFLRSINSSQPHFIGQAGLGNKEEFGLLSLQRNENFCMGGPGMVLSHVVLKKMAVHISYCLKNLYTTHEDVEIGRCIQKFAFTSCTWAFEVS